jgi:hypothetical protein
MDTNSDNANAAGSDNNGATDNNAPAWTEGFDEDTMGYVSNKGWKSPTDVLTSYRNLEKLAGGSKNIVELPGEDADAEALGKFYDRLGRPDAPESYTFKMPEENGDEQLDQWFRKVAHDSGLTDAQAKGLYDQWNTMAGVRNEAMENAIRERNETELNDLKKEWGADFDSNIQNARVAARAVGYGEEELVALENKLGTGEFLKLWSKVGALSGEDSFADGERSGGAFGTTASEAKAQLADLRNDKAFMDRYLGGDKDAVAKYTRLMEKAHG